MADTRSPNDWSQLSSLVDALLEAPPEKRGDLIAELSGTDAMRRVELEQIIAEFDRETPLAARPAAERTTEAVRTLRKALGYCWSVAVTADPAAGLPLFTVLSGQEDADLQWIVRENRKKSRLAGLLRP